MSKIVTVDYHPEEDENYPWFVVVDNVVVASYQDGYEAETFASHVNDTK